MKTCAAILLLMALSLEAAALLVAAGRLSAASMDSDAAIRLPSEGLAAQAMGPTRPWACCDFDICSTESPPYCRCLDIVDQCDAACNYCRQRAGGKECFDVYIGDVGPKCTKVPSAAPSSTKADTVSGGGGN